ncbi:MAG TPA: sigma-70 family RNA polymerase sigma factor [Pirellulales bacterium]|jgi:RNA polymerase sigma-70 factor (ECF subfamily)|nr:sigma-70 family RNA polymerase sigma factor [Pirellulales bacterium]
MNAGPLDTLLSKLNEGDSAAAEQAFLAYEPFLRMVVRRRLSAGLRAKFDSMDIVQSAWADLLDGFRKSKWSFQDANQLRAFLVKVTQNRFVDRLRQHRAGLKRELALSQADIEALASTRSSRVSENFQADELWRQMLEVCPPAHYELLELKRQGASLAEIAARTHLHPSSVRRILYDIARRIALRQAAGTR